MKVLLLLAVALPLIACDIITGGQHPYTAQLTDPEVVFAVNEINNLFKTNGDTKPRAAEKIISATSQVVSGVMYRFQIEVSGGVRKELCSVSVWSRPWLSGAEKTQIQGTPTCVPEPIILPQVRSVVGGQQETTLTDPEVEKAASFLEVKLNARSNSLYYLKVTDAAKVTKQAALLSIVSIPLGRSHRLDGQDIHAACLVIDCQKYFTMVVNGVIYRFTDLTFAMSDCTKNEAAAGNKQCAVSGNPPAQQTCSVEVYWNPRQTPEYTVNSDSCA